MYFALLDLLRFLSSVGVFFHHNFYFYYGKLGVYLFFMISGFVIYFSLNRGIKDYIISRFLRLYPIFWVCASITFLVTLFYKDNLISVKNFFIGLLMFNSGRMETMIDGSYWTLTFELLFYFYIGVFVWLFSTKRLEWFYISWLLISFSSFFFKIDQIIVFKLLCVRFAPYFVFGGMLALLIDRYKSIDLKSKVLYISTLIASAIMPIYVSDRLMVQLKAGTITNFTGSFSPNELIIVESFFIVFPLFVFLSFLSFTKNKTFVKFCFILGGITYPLYLLHWKVGDTIITHYGYNYGELNKFSVFIAIIIFLVSYLLSVFDLRLRKFLRKKILGY